MNELGRSRRDSRDWWRSARSGYWKAEFLGCLNSPPKIKVRNSMPGPRLDPIFQKMMNVYTHSIVLCYLIWSSIWLAASLTKSLLMRRVLNITQDARHQLVVLFMLYNFGVGSKVIGWTAGLEFHKNVLWSMRAIFWTYKILTFPVICYVTSGWTCNILYWAVKELSTGMYKIEFW